MNRRQLLSIIPLSCGIGLAGCTDNTSTDDVNDTGNSDTADNVGDENTIESDLNELPEELDGIEYQINPFFEQADPKNQIIVNVELTNITDEDIIYGDQRDALFWHVISESGFQLYPLENMSDEQIEYDEEHEVWYTENAFMTTEEFQIGSLEPDETYSEELILLYNASQSSVSEEMPEIQGFETELSIGSSNESEELFENRASWEFRLHVNCSCGIADQDN